MDVDSYTIMRAITDMQELSPTQRLVGFVLALHYNRASKFSRLRRDTICKETGLGLWAVKDALHNLVAAKVFEPRRTGRATAYRVGKRVEEWMACLPSRLMVCEPYHQKSNFDPRKAMPWEFDPAMTTRAEEEDKRWRDRL